MTRPTTKPGPAPTVEEGLSRSLFLPRKQWAAIDARAKQLRLSRSEYVRRMLEEHFR